MSQPALLPTLRRKLQRLPNRLSPTDSTTCMGGGLSGRGLAAAAHGPARAMTRGGPGGLYGPGASPTTRRSFPSTWPCSGFKPGVRRT
jgi:hypothetical protein